MEVCSPITAASISTVAASALRIRLSVRQPCYPPDGVWQYDLGSGQWSTAVLSGVPLNRSITGMSFQSFSSPSAHFWLGTELGNLCAAAAELGGSSSGRNERPGSTV